MRLLCVFCSLVFSLPLFAQSSVDSLESLLASASLSPVNKLEIYEELIDVYLQSHQYQRTEQAIKQMLVMAEELNSKDWIFKANASHAILYYRQEK